RATLVLALSLHDALPICVEDVYPRFLQRFRQRDDFLMRRATGHQIHHRHAEHDNEILAAGLAYRLDNFHRETTAVFTVAAVLVRSEEHTSELQSRENLVC